MRFDLSALARRARNPRRKSVTLRDIPPPAIFASNLYRSVYARVVALWTRRIDRIVAEYERTLSGLTTDAPVDIQGLLDDGDQELLRLLLEIRPSLSDWAVLMESWFRSKWTAAVLSASGVDLSTLLSLGDVQRTVEQSIEWQTSLVKDVSAQTRQRIGNAVFDGLRNRTPAAEVAKTIREATGMARRRSLGIASDQLSKLTSDLATARRQQAGLSVYEWKHSFKKHPRAWHADRDGNYYSSDPDMIGREVDGKTVMQEVEASDRPGRPPFCGCRELSVLVFD